MNKVNKTNKMSKTKKLSFFLSRRKRGDMTSLAKRTGYSCSHLSNITSGVRSINDEIANAMYSMTRNRVARRVARRVKTSTPVNA